MQSLRSVGDPFYFCFFPVSGSALCRQLGVEMGVEFLPSSAGTAAKLVSTMSPRTLRRRASPRLPTVAGYERPIVAAAMTEGEAFHGGQQEPRRKTSQGSARHLVGSRTSSPAEATLGCRMAQVHRPHHEPHAAGVDNRGLCQLPMQYMVYPYVGVSGIDLGL
jgi:hypothetical protein